MKSLATLIHKTPWWAIILGGGAFLVALAVFVTPFYLIRLDRMGATPAENEAIKREVAAAFSEGAIDVARGALREMRRRAKDPSKRAELDRALDELDEASDELRIAGEDALRARREAGVEVAAAVKEAAAEIRQAQKETARALEGAGVQGERIQKKLESALEATREAEEEVRRATEEKAQAEGAKEGEKAEPPQKPGKRRIVIGGMPGKPAIDIQLDDKGPTVVQLDPERRAEIRKHVTSDLYRVGVGAGLVLLFIPLFILTIVAKILIDRQRAAQQVAEVKRKEAEYHRMSQQVTEAKLQALQAQVEPHFLYNTLASVQALTEVDPQQANAMTGHLIQYLRNALPKMRESVSTVGQEIELVRAYLNILQMRMGKRLSFEIVVPPELVDAPFPPLMLPSLVENAIKHGLEPVREGGRVTITAEARDGKLRVSVADTGRGFSEPLGSGVGLANIRERLLGLYGDAAKLTLEANSPQGVVATIEVPRDGMKRPAAAAPGVPPASAAPAQPEPPQSLPRRAFSAFLTGERIWRKGLSFMFVALVIVAAVVCGLALFGVIAGVIPVEVGDAHLIGPTGTLVGAATVIIAFLVLVLAIAIVVAVIYGLGFVLATLAVFIPVVVVVSLVPALAPFILVGLLVWWLVRRSQRKEREKQSE